MTDMAQTVNLGLLLREYRNQAGITQVQLAEHSDVSIRTIRDLELGRSKCPRRWTIQLIAAGLKLADEHRWRLHLAAGHRGVAMGEALHTVSALPAEPTGPFFGRAAEVENLVERLTCDVERLVTVSGIGGVGKTRVALAAARQVNGEHGLPVLWVPLTEAAGAPESDSPGRSAGLLSAWVRETLSGVEDPVSALVPVIGRERLLLVLDGAEDTPLSRALLSGLVERCPRLRILITSRRPSADGGVVSLHPLPLPRDPARRETNPGAELFAWHARKVRPDFELTDANAAAVAEICHSLDGHPGALEAAASWLLLWSLESTARVARTDPGQLMQTPVGRSSDDWLLNILSGAVAALPPRQNRLLKALTAADGAWTLDEASARVEEPVTKIAASVYALMLHGLVRPLGPNGEGQPLFSVLNLFRRSPLAPAGRPGPLNLP